MHFTSHVDIYILPATLQVYLSYEVLDAVEKDKMKSLSVSPHGVLCMPLIWENP